MIFQLGYDELYHPVSLELGPSVNEKLDRYVQRKLAEEAIQNENELRKIFNSKLEEEIKKLNDQHQLVVEETERELDKKVVYFENQHFFILRHD